MIRPLLKLALIIVWVALFYAPTWIAFKTKKFALRDWLVRYCDRGILAISGIRLTVTGSLSVARPLLIVSNHISYMDVPILGSVASVRFTPKKEIAAWPVIGSICRMLECVFVDRSSARVGEGKEEIGKALAGGNPVSVFPEATTGDGRHMLPFKSGFFKLAEENAALSVQPVAIIYKSIRNLPIDSIQWPGIAWYGDMELAPHVMEFLKLGQVEVELAFLPAVTIEGFGDRKKLALHCEQAIAAYMDEVKHAPRAVAQKRRFSVPVTWSRSKS
jgi:1-acyl-sn-glycerol-3-phosphate acyltransferase